MEIAPTNLYDMEVIKYAHLLGEMQKLPWSSENERFSDNDRKFLKDIFYNVRRIEYHKLSDKEMRNLKSKVLHYAGTRSWTIHEDKGATI